jgi:hypothetical protein
VGGGSWERVADGSEWDWEGVGGSRGERVAGGSEWDWVVVGGSRWEGWQIGTSGTGRE